MLFLTGKKGSPTALIVRFGQRLESKSSRFLTGPSARFGMAKCFVWGKGHHRLAQPATAPSRTAQTHTVAELARFFPEATPVRIPVQFTRSNNTSNGSQPGGESVEESTIIEFGTSREVLFACATPLEFADILRLRNSDGSLDTEASVVAVQYHPGRTIVAARFVNSVPNWIVKS
jgi:hypothetical protein